LVALAGGELVAKPALSFLEETLFLKEKTSMRLSKKIAIAAVSTIAAVGVATSAFAYWTTSGGGSGTAGAASATSDLVITGDPALGIHPGGSVAVSGNVHNPNPSSSMVNVVSATVGTSNSDCLPADFHFAPVTVNKQVAAGGNQAFSGTLTMDDTALSQDACKNATIILTYSSTSL
jgi:hypothetical protein